MTVRIALALLFIVPAAMAFPWQSDADWWLLGSAVAVTLAVFAWWRGQFVTTMVARRLAVLRRNHSKPKRQNPNRATVVVRVADPAGAGLPLPLLAGYLARFGVRSDKVRVTTRTLAGARTTWISITIDAIPNLAALQARLPELPLEDTALTAGRRLAGELREAGLEASVVDAAEAPLVAAAGKETWREVRDEHGVVSAYAIPVDGRLSERLAEVSALPRENWIAMEFTGSGPNVAVVCALRTDEAVRGVPLPGVGAQRGVQRPLLLALDPKSTDRLGVPARRLSAGVLDGVEWPVAPDGALSRT